MKQQLKTDTGCEFGYEVKDNFIIIVDLNTGRSVTNDAENVIKKICVNTNIDPEKYNILYRDTQGRWDGLKLMPSLRSVGFIPIGGNNEKEAIDIFKKIVHYKK